jgi:hypothetical protein
MGSLSLRILYLGVLLYGCEEIRLWALLPPNEMHKRLAFR